jgi:hypothetical protein
VGDLNTFAVDVVTFLRIMFLEKKYLRELYSSVQIVIITMRPNVEARLLWDYDISVSYSLTLDYSEKHSNQPIPGSARSILTPEYVKYCTPKYGCLLVRTY